MKTYDITIEHIGYAHYTVKASSEEEAIAQAWKKFNVADADNFVENSIFDIEEIEG